MGRKQEYSLLSRDLISYFHLKLPEVLPFLQLSIILISLFVPTSKELSDFDGVLSLEVEKENETEVVSVVLLEEAKDNLYIPSRDLYQFRLEVPSGAQKGSTSFTLGDSFGNASRLVIGVVHDQGSSASGQITFSQGKGSNKVILILGVLLVILLLLLFISCLCYLCNPPPFSNSTSVDQNSH